MILFNETAEAERILELIDECQRIPYGGRNLPLSQIIAGLRNNHPSLTDLLLMLHHVNNLVLCRPTAMTLRCDNKQQVFLVLSRFFWRQARKSGAERSPAYTALEKETFTRFGSVTLRPGSLVTPEGEKLTEEQILRQARFIMNVLVRADMTMTALGQIDLMDQLLMKLRSPKGPLSADRISDLLHAWRKGLPALHLSDQQAQNLDVYDNQTSLLSCVVKTYHDSLCPESADTATVSVSVARNYPPESVLLYLLSSRLGNDQQYRALPMPWEKLPVYADRSLRAGKTFYDRAMKKPLWELAPFFNIYHVRPRHDLIGPNADLPAGEPDAVIPWGAPAVREPHTLPDPVDEDALIQGVLQQASRLNTPVYIGQKIPPDDNDKLLSLQDKGANEIYLALNEACCASEAHRRGTRKQSVDLTHQLICSLMQAAPLDQETFAAARIALRGALEADLRDGTLTGLSAARNLTLIKYATDNWRTGAVMQMLVYLALRCRTAGDDTCPPALLRLRNDLSDGSDGLLPVSDFIRSGLDALDEMTLEAYLAVRSQAVENNLLRASLTMKDNVWAAEVWEYIPREQKGLRDFLLREKGAVALKDIAELACPHLPISLNHWIRQALTFCFDQPKGCKTTKPYYLTGRGDPQPRALHLLLVWLISREGTSVSLPTGDRKGIRLQQTNTGVVFLGRLKSITLQEALSGLWENILARPDAADALWDDFCATKTIKIAPLNGMLTAFINVYQAKEK